MGDWHLSKPWRAPGVSVAVTIRIPEVPCFYPADAPKDWERMALAWIASGLRDFGVWGVHEPLIRSRRYGTPKKEKHKAYAFVETFVGSELERNGFTCYRSARLFVPKYQQNMRQANTRAVRGLLKSLGLPLPHLVQAHFDRELKNPDLTAYNAETKDLRFCEVKRKGERVPQKQIDGLGALHLITGAPVAIVRVLPEGTAHRPKKHEARLAYSGPELSIRGAAPR